MKKYYTKLGAIAMSAVIALSLAPITGLAATGYGADKVPVYGFYNPNSGEHLFTIDKSEAQNLTAAGWQEGDIKWYAPTSGNPVYRLYNPNVFASDGTPLGDHHYTANPDEVKDLLAAGWKEGNVVFYSANKTDADAAEVYCVYNPNAYFMGMSGAHHLTLSHDEALGLIRSGWRGMDVKFYGFHVIDVLEDRWYEAMDFDRNGRGSISDDRRMLTMTTRWGIWNDSIGGYVSVYPKKEYHIPISENCMIIKHIGMNDYQETYPLSEQNAEGLHSLINYMGTSIKVENGEIVEFSFSS